MTITKIIASATILFAYLHAEQIPVSYEVSVGLASTTKFVLHDIVFSRGGKSFFSASVENETHTNWSYVAFLVHVRINDGTETNFYAVPVRNVWNEIFPAEQTLIFEQGFRDARPYDPAAVAGYTIEVRGKMETPVQSNRYSGLVFAEDCIDGLAKALAAPVGLERRRKIKELINLACTQDVTHYKVASSTTRRRLGPDQREYILAVLVDDSDLGTSGTSGWIAKDDITLERRTEYIDYEVPRATLPAPTLSAPPNFMGVPPAPSKPK